MPVSRRNAEQSTSSATPVTNPHEFLRPYIFHGIDLTVKGGHGVGDCPFCSGEGKFSVDVTSGLWRCFVCGGGTDSGGGNALTFLRLLHATAAASTPPDWLARVASDRRLCDPGTLTAWGVCRSPIPPYPWLVAGYAPDGRLDQVYKRTYVDKSWKLLPTPGVWPEGKVHALHLPSSDFDSTRSEVTVCEGPWDGMALWEVAITTDACPNIIAVPGCNIWRSEWTKFLEGKQVTLLFDSDHPRIQGTKTFIAGYDGMARVAKKLSGSATKVRVLMWGPDGYDPSVPSGYDVRDMLSDGNNSDLGWRSELLKELLTKVIDAPQDWFNPTVAVHTLNGSTKSHSVESRDCSTWVACETAWKDAMRWRQDMSDALAVMLAVCASTQQSGNQLFLDVVGSPGAGKTSLCEGLLVSHHCHHLEHLTGFHSGYKKKDDPDKDCSLIARINGKTLITPEFDIMRSSPRYNELMGQTRRIFDGKSGATYKNTDEDTLYVGLRTPWIRAGTPSSIMDSDQSQLGDRFLRIIIGDPVEEEKREIMRSALRSERVAMLDQANGTAGSIVDPKTRLAYALTGGYVDWLRANVEEKLTSADMPVEAENQIIDLADLSADLRARPGEDKKKRESHDCKELPTRLARQYGRLASHLAVVLNKCVIDSEVLRIVRKVAFNTAHGHSLSIVQWLCRRNPKSPGQTFQTSGGISAKVFEVWLGMTEDRINNYLLFLRKIDVLVMLQLAHGMQTWALTDRIHNLYLRVMNG